jgi:hypothetical protein
MFSNLKEGTQLMAIYTPYFYIIQDIRNSVYYAGAKWERGCHPDQLLKEGGYETSSETIKELIRSNGINSFVVRKIRTFATAKEAQNYETRFLQKINAKSHPRFYNGHNNDGAMDHNKMKFIMMERYGVEYPMQSITIQEKVRITNIEKYGIEWQIQSKETREKTKNTLNERYGVNHNLSIPEVIDKIKQTNIEKYGVDNPYKSKDIKEKIKRTNERLYGGFTFESPILREKVKQTLKQRYGVEHNSQSELVKEKVKIKVDYLLNRPILDIIRKYKQKYKLTFGPGWVRKSDEYVESLLEELISKYGEIEETSNNTIRINYLYNRPEIEILKQYQKRYNLKFGKGWTRKSDTFINDLLNDLISEYGVIDY